MPKNERSIEKMRVFLTVMQFVFCRDCRTKIFLQKKLKCPFLTQTKMSYDKRENYFLYKMNNLLYIRYNLHQRICDLHFVRTAAICGTRISYSYMQYVVRYTRFTLLLYSNVLC